MRIHLGLAKAETVHQRSDVVAKALEVRRSVLPRHHNNTSRCVDIFSEREERSPLLDPGTHRYDHHDNQPPPPDGCSDDDADGTQLAAKGDAKSDGGPRFGPGGLLIKEYTTEMDHDGTERQVLHKTKIDRSKHNIF